MSRIFILFSVLVFLCGCAALKQATSDYQTGSSTPLAVNEVAPSTQGQVIGNTVASLPIPFAGPAGMAVGFLATIFFTWQRGVAIRKNNGLVPATQTTSSSITEGLVQSFANIFAGMFTTASQTAPTTTGSTFQRIWKVTLATVLSGATIAATQPSLQTFLMAHPIISSALALTPAVITGIEKAFSAVQPIATVVAATT